MGCGSAGFGAAGFGAAGFGAAHAAAACTPAGGDPGLVGCPAGGAPAALPVSGPSTGIANPVDLASGNKHQHEPDFVAPDGLSGLPLARSYNSRLAGRTGDFGPGWQHGYEAVLWRAAADRIQLLQADGRRLRFMRAPGQGPAAVFHGADPADGRLEADGGGFVWIWPDGRRLRFEAGSGRLVSIDAGAQGVLRLRYRNGRLVAVRAADGSELVLEHDAAGRIRVATRHDARGASTARIEYEHDALGNLVAARMPGLTRRYRYEDPLHPHHLSAVEIERPPYVTRTLGRWRYDAAGQAVAHEDALGRVTAIGYGAAPRAADPRRVRVTDSAGRVAEYRFGRIGDRLRLVSVRGLACASCLPAPADFGYDPEGRLTEARIGTHLLRIERDGRGLPRTVHLGTTRYTLDAAGRLAGWAGPGIGAVHLRRDARGRLEAAQDASGRVLRLRRDPDGRLVERIESAPGSAPSVTRLRREGTQLVAIEHAHAPLRLEGGPGVRVQTLVEGRGKLRIRRSFESAAGGRRHAETLAPGLRLVRRHDAHGRLRGIELEADGGRRRQAIVSAVEYGAHGPTRLRLGNGVELTIERDARGRPRAWMHRALRCRVLAVGCSTRVLLEHALRFRADGRIGSVRTVLEGQAPRITQYDYDAHGRLLQAIESPTPTAGERRHRFAYDLAGRRLLADPTGPCRPMHDASGRQTRCGAHAYRYDAGGRLAEVTQHGRLVARHRYDAAGHRVSTRDAHGRERHFAFDAGRLVAEYDDQGRLVRRYVYAGPLPIAVLDRDPADPAKARRPRLHFLHADHLGAPLLVTDAGTMPVWRASYTPFGAARIEHSRDGFRLDLRRPGQVLDPATGLVDQVHRWYDPASGRFLSPDPAGLNGGPDRHAYAAHDPVNHVDPDGRLLVAFDGTWNFTDPASDPLAPQGDASNVWLMHQLYDVADGLDASGRPVVTRFYERGIGTDAGLFDRWLAGATGYTGLMKVERQIAQVGRYLASADLDARTVMLDVVGFSRGAALARDFVNRLLDAQARGAFAASGRCVAVRFLGLFDTVAMFGIGGTADHRFDLTVPASVGWTAHAVALNEHHPLLPLESIEGSSARHVEQPLLGGHGDIGGGYLYEAPERHPGDLSNVALQWMIGQARRAGLGFAALPERYSQVGTPVLHDERRPLGRLDLADDRSIRFPETGAPSITQTDARYRDPVYGQNLEALIERPARLDGSNFGGTVRMAEYRGWLEANAGFTLP